MKKRQDIVVTAEKSPQTDRWFIYSEQDYMKQERVSTAALLSRVSSIINP